MPSNNTRAVSPPTNCSLLVLALLVLIQIILVPLIVSLSIYPFASFGIKAYVLHNFAFEQFRPCRLAYLYQYIEVTFYMSVFFLCIGSVVLFCAVVSSESRSDVCMYFGSAVLCFVLLHIFIYFTGSMLIWTPLPTPEELLMFYPEFYEIPFKGCATGELFEGMSLANLVFRIESSLIMIGLMLIVPCSCFWTIICALAQDSDNMAMQAQGSV